MHRKPPFLSDDPTDWSADTDLTARPPSVETLHGFLFDAEGNLVLRRLEQARKAGLWASPVAKRLPLGADREEMFRRELKAALGIEPESVDPVGAITETDDEKRKVVRLFAADAKGLPTDLSHIEGVRPYPLPQVRQLIAEGKTTGTFKRLFELYEDRRLHHEEPKE